MARLTIALLALVGLTAASSSGAGPPMLVSPSFGVSYGGSGLVARDHGRWRDITPPRMRGAVYALDFLDARNGWVFTGDCGRDNFALHRTADGGRSWRSSAVAGADVGCHAGDGAQLDFVDSTYGWLTIIAATAPFAELYRTVDGGATWRRLRHRLPILGRIRFRTQSDGWLGESLFQVSRTLYRTGDAGRTWHRVNLAAPPGYSPKRVFPEAPTFFGARGILPVTVIRHHRIAVAFYTTVDGGDRWRLRRIHPVKWRPLRFPFAVYVPASIASPTAWWIAEGRQRPFVSVTVDGGKTWFRKSRLPAATGWQLSAASARTAWLSTYEPYRLLETTDGGRTWHRLFPR